MNRRHFITLTAIGALAACGSYKIDYPVAPSGSAAWRVSSVSVNVPDALVVSTQDQLNPPADIVWWEDGRPYGKDRVTQILTDAVRAGAAKAQGTQSVRLAVTLVRFHGMTPSATNRLTVSGVHNVDFVAQVFSASTGAPLTEPTRISADVPGLHGEELRASIERGATDKARVSGAISSAIAGWLGAGPDVRQSFSRLGS